MFRNIFVSGSATAFIFAFLLISPSVAQNVPTILAQCQGNAAPQQRSAACGTLIDGGLLDTRDMALARYFRASAELDLGHRTAALGDLDKALAADDSLWIAHWLRGEVADGRRLYATTETDWTAVIKILPKAQTAYMGRGSARDLAGDAAGAVADFEKAVELAGSAGPDADVYFGRAEAYYGALDLDRAKADFDQAIQRETHRPTYYSGRAIVRYLMGDTDGALTDLSRITELRSNEYYYLLWLYLAELREGKTAESNLRDRSQGFNLSQWPGPIVRLLLGDTVRDQIVPPPEPELWSAADRKLGSDCEMDFFLGEQALLKGDKAKAKTLFKNAMSTGIKEYVEYRAAKFELEHMKP